MMEGKEIVWTEDEEVKNTPVLDFYRNKCIFLTGGSGFIGKLLLEKLLRIKVKEIVLLLRPKKGKTTNERITEMFSGVVFHKLKTNDLSFMKRIKIIEGDLQVAGLGLSEESQDYIRKNAQIVFHVAADVKFDRSLKKAVEVNVRGTRDLLRMLEKAEKIEAIVYVSTVYSHCVNLTIEEKFYPPPTDADKMIEFVENMDENFEKKINKLTQDLIHPWPNTYVYSKALAEDIVRRFSMILPISVVRPSIVIATVEDPVAGWTDNIYGLNGAIIGIAMGIIRVLNINNDVVADVIPADYVVNSILVVAEKTSSESIVLEENMCSKVGKIYNCVSSPDNPIDWKQIYDYSIYAGSSVPPMKSMWIVSFTAVTNPYIYSFLKFVLHILPAFIIDFVFKVLGKKPRLMDLYDKVHKFSAVITYFANTKWTIKNDNMRSVVKSLNKNDKKLFQCDIELMNWMDYFHIYDSDDSEAHVFDGMPKKLLEEEQQPETYGSLSKGSLFYYVNTIVGSGVIGIAYALHRSGFYLGIILLILVAVITDYSLILMIQCAHLCGRFTYTGVMEAAFGKIGYYLLSILQFMYPFLAMISYNVVVGDTISKVLVRFIPSLGSSMGSVRFFVVFLVTLFITTPLCLYKDVSRLARISFISLVCIMLILLAVLYKQVILNFFRPKTPDAWKFAHGDVIGSLGVFSYAFFCHHNTFLVYHSMQNATLQRWEKVTHISVGFAWAFAFLFGIAGYATFRELSQGDLLENYCFDDDLMNFARILFSISILLTFPIEACVVRQIIRTQIKRFVSPEFVEYEKEADPEHDHGEDSENNVLITLAIVFLAFFVSPTTECLGPILELNGLLAAIPLSYILPGLIFIQLDPHSLFSREKLPAVGLVVFGVVVTICGSAVLFPNLGSDCSTGIVLGYCKDDELAMNSSVSVTHTTPPTRIPTLPKFTRN
ncbi:unnamed protein product [Diamesa serratosioi]